MTNYKRLWCAVLYQAFDDLKFIKRNEKMKSFYLEMKEYLKSGKTLSEISEKTGIKESSIYSRMNTYNDSISLYRDLKNFFRKSEHMSFICCACDINEDAVIKKGRSVLNTIDLGVL
ncbi:MAG: hypothetical protein WC373_12855 [Smithella sp.]